MTRSALVRGKSAILVFSLAFFKSEFEELEASRCLRFRTNSRNRIPANFQGR